MNSNLDAYQDSSVNDVSYPRLQAIFDEMFNHGFVCDTETMVQFIRDNGYLPGLTREQVEEACSAFINDTYNG